MLSVVILTHNEAHKLRRLLPKLTFADKILILDDYSTDRTVAVAREYGARVVRRKLNQDWSAQRNEALRRVRTKWVLFLDPDEIPSKKLVASIKRVMQMKEPDTAYAVRRVNIFKGKKLYHGEVGRTLLVRFGQTAYGKFSGVVHERWEVDDPGFLEGYLWHYSHENYNLMKKAILKYARMQADDDFKSGKDWSLFEWVFYPIGKWLRSVIWYQALLDGLPGIQMAWLHSLHSFKVRHYLHELYFPAKRERLTERILVRLFWLIFVAVILGQGLRLEQFPVPIYGHELLMVVYFGLFIFVQMRRRKIYLSPLMPTMSLFMVILIGSLFWQRLPVSQLFVPSLYWWRLIVYFGFFIATYNLFVVKWIRIEPERLLFTAAVLFALGGYVQYLLFPDLRQLIWFGWDDHYYRMVGTLLDPAYLSLILAMGLLLAERWSGRRLALAYGFLGGALLLTYSRSAYGVYIAGICLLLAQWRAFKGLIWRLGLLGLGLGALYAMPLNAGESVNLLRTYSIESRASSTLTALEIFVKNPVFGIGYNRYRDLLISHQRQNIPFHPSSPDNSMALVAATSGMIGLLGLLGLAYKVSTTYRHIPTVITLSFMFALYGMTNNSWFYPVLLWWMSILWSSSENYSLE
jgi:glycosyltransferase involved in cell wall biosynthesis